MPFGSYTELQATVLDWIARPGDPLVAPAVPDMIAMFEEEARDRLQTRFTEITVQLSPVEGKDTIPLPLDYAQLLALWVNTSMGRRHLQHQSAANLDQNMALYYLDKYPAAYTIEHLHLRILGTPVLPASEVEATGAPVTLTPGASATLYADAGITPSSFIGLMPQTLNAADALASLWVERGTGSAVIHHANSSNADQTFTVALCPGGLVSLSASATATAYSDSSITPGSFVGLMPLTLNAANAFSSVWVAPGTGTAIIRHASSPNVDQTFAVGLFEPVTPPTPPIIYLHYSTGIPPLSADMPTNWLLTQYPSAYLWGTLSFAAPYIGDDARLQLWLSARESAIERIRLADRRAKFPYGLMIQTDVRNP